MPAGQRTTIGFLLFALAALGLVVLTRTAPGAPTAAASSRHGTRVVCLNEKTFNHEYKRKPAHCVFHKRHAPNAEAFFVRTQHDRWRVWKRAKAHGRGRAIESMGGPARVRIRLSHPVRRCGHRVFARAHFRFPDRGTGGGFRLDTCA